MNSLFEKLSLSDINQDYARNIVSLCESQDLFDDLTDNPAEVLLAQSVEDEVKLHLYRSPTPIIDRPFEDAAWFNAIGWPFTHWQTSRFSDGSYGVWYGADSVETTVYESVYRWYHGLLCDAGFERESVVAERKVYMVACKAALLDFRQATSAYSELMHPTDYDFAQLVGARIHREGHPGLLIQSVRRPYGESVAVFNPAVLSNPRFSCQLTYRLDGGKVMIEKQSGAVWLTLDAILHR